MVSVVLKAVYGIRMPIASKQILTTKPLMQRYYTAIVRDIPQRGRSHKTEGWNGTFWDSDRTIRFIFTATWYLAGAAANSFEALENKLWFEENLVSDSALVLHLGSGEVGISFQACDWLHLLSFLFGRLLPLHQEEAQNISREPSTNKQSWGSET